MAPITASSVFAFTIRGFIGFFVGGLVVLLLVGLTGNEPFIDGRISTVVGIAAILAGLIVGGLAGWHGGHRLPRAFEAAIRAILIGAALGGLIGYFIYAPWRTRTEISPHSVFYGKWLVPHQRTGLAFGLLIGSGAGFLAFVFGRQYRLQPKSNSGSSE